LIRLIISSISCFMNKDEFRKIYLTKRLALTKKEHHELSLKISDLFFQSVDLSKIHILHIYLPIESKHEPNTWLLIDRIQREFPDIRLVIPRVNGEEMLNIFLEGRDQLENTRWGMVEPKEGKHANPGEIDMVIVPLLAVDKQGHRIGYGKGYYDRFLKLCRPDCLKIGISFFEPEQSIEEKSSDDVLLNACLTPFNFFQF
jgi:5-formyltetrahydrofolate cyclo-ligase